MTDLAFSPASNLKDRDAVVVALVLFAQDPRSINDLQIEIAH
jgi:hypothetical protein